MKGESGGKEEQRTKCPCPVRAYDPWWILFIIAKISISNYFGSQLGS